jgi:4a-hydroxytetrahydrobiopterin dehydratase
MNLADRDCIPCRGGIPPLGPEQSAALLDQLGSGWECVDGHHLRKAYAFPNFAEARVFRNKVGEIAEAQGHHPDIELGWGRVVLSVHTHSIDGLTESDFILAAKSDEVA